MMSFPTAVKTCFSKYAEFSGRAQRSEFWWFTLFMAIAVVVVDVAVALAVPSSPDTINIVGWIAQLIFLLPSIAVAVRRLHDCDASGWHYLWMFLPVLGAIGLFIWFCFPGTPGDNRFGSDPLNSLPDKIAEVF
jgi:uncharacterized membrane protein YhaH (DUF805 family)